jgi:hypothetical protein
MHRQRRESRCKQRRHPHTGEQRRQCGSASESVEARDTRRLAGDKPPDIVAFLAWLSDLDTWILSAPVLSMEATRIGNKGVVLVMVVHHAITDGLAV